MKASLPFKYIIAEKKGKNYVVFDFKDDSGKRKRKWVTTDLAPGYWSDQRVQGNRVWN